MKHSSNVILAETRGKALWLSLNRPERRNAMNPDMIRELTRALSGDIGQRHHLVVLEGKGPDFSSGADLNWMREGLQQPPELLASESLELARLFRCIWESPVPVLTLVQGRALGGAMGLIAASDLVLAREDALFGFPEVGLGLVPATIAPYVRQKTGLGHALALMLTGRIFGAAEALSLGLVHQTSSAGSWEANAGRLVETLSSHGREALSGIRTLLRDPRLLGFDDGMDRFTAGEIARFRTSADAQERMTTFLNAHGKV
ncbi:MAG: enoyl-CoA hydratase-related protein [Bacteroidales bacterium]